jgi:hypothetical protein
VCITAVLQLLTSSAGQHVVFITLKTYITACRHIVHLDSISKSSSPAAAAAAAATTKHQHGKSAAAAAVPAMLAVGSICQTRVLAALMLHRMLCNCPLCDLVTCTTPRVLPDTLSIQAPVEGLGLELGKLEANIYLLILLLPLLHCLLPMLLSYTLYMDPLEFLGLFTAAVTKTIT